MRRFVVVLLSLPPLSLAKLFESLAFIVFVGDKYKHLTTVYIHRQRAEKRNSIAWIKRRISNTCGFIDWTRLVLVH